VIKRAHIGGRGKTKPYQRTSSHLTLNLRAIAPKVVTSAPVIARSVSDAAIPDVKKSVTPKKAVKTTKKIK
jgi:hypothetical protein